MNIILRELRANLKSLLIWSVCIFALFAASMSEFSAYYNNPNMAELLNSIPEAILSAFSINAVNLTTVTGYASIISSYIYIILGIHAVLLGNSILSKEERDKTAEFLYSLPVSRSSILIKKMISAILNCLILLGIVALAMMIFTAKYNPTTAFYDFFKLSLLVSFILQMLFLSIGMLLASILKRYKKSGFASLIILLGTYILSIMIDLNGKIDYLKYITPFKYFESIYLVNENKLDSVYVILSISIIIICTVLTFIFYSKRDLQLK